jgi:moderate conductance mechanosensitive channel
MSCRQWLKTVFVLLVFGLFFLNFASLGLATHPMQALLKGSKKTNDAAASGAATLPKPLTPENIDGVIAAMSDEQVRRLLINDLKKQAAAEAAAQEQNDRVEGFQGFMQNIRAKVALAKVRIEDLKTNRKGPYKGPDAIFHNQPGSPGDDPLQTILSVLAIFLGAAVVEFLFGRWTRAYRRRIEVSPQKKWYGKIGALALRGGFDLLHIVVFFVASVIFFQIFLAHTNSQRVVMDIYLVALFIVRLIQVAARFLLVPNVPALRVLPLRDAAVDYLYRGILIFSSVGSFGITTCVMAWLAGASEGAVFVSMELTSIVTVLIVFWMIIQKRKEVAAAMGRGLPDGSIRARLVAGWHYFAIVVMALVYLSGFINHLLDITGRFEGSKTLAIIVFYLLLDWLLKQILKAAFGITRNAGEVRNAASPAPADAAPAGEGGKAPSESLTGPLSTDRVQLILKRGLRIALAASIFFWILDVWQVSLPIGESVVNATFDILAALVLCYVIWELINTAISRKIAETTMDVDEDQEEGGAGGSRAGTLLLLLRKFMMAVMVVLIAMIGLSRMGINIGPLIAGAGVIGVAIGFGAQTLVKDIISGMFFLIDDAFRVGDYIEVGSAKGMVEHISLRSFKLRHPRGMVNTIPFGNIDIVTNMSRDYIISKLDFRVRYDADVDKIRKIIKKKVYKEIIKDKELASKLMGKIKSQGVRELDDSAMIMRVKFKTIPGEQFVIRKEVFRLMQEAFKEAGIEFAHKNVTVYLPPEVQKAVEEDPAVKKKVLQAGTAAAAASLQDEKQT